MEELCLHFTPAGPPRSTIIFVPPLFDEANRTRRTLVATMRSLCGLGHAAMLPDLPGQNDSLLPTREATLAGWRAGLAVRCEAVDGPKIIASWRGGALIDDAASNAAGWWRMAPQSGASIVKTLLRVRVAGDKEAGIASSVDGLRALAAADGTVELAGNGLSAAMLGQLDAATPATVAPLRSVMPGAGDAQIAGTPLWLRSEPGEDLAMAEAMAKDIARWADQCVAG